MKKIHDFHLNKKGKKPPRNLAQIYVGRSESVVINGQNLLNFQNHEICNPLSNKTFFLQHIKMSNTKEILSKIEMELIAIENLENLQKLETETKQRKKYK